MQAVTKRRTGEGEREEGGLETHTNTVWFSAHHLQCQEGKTRHREKKETN